MSTVVSHSSEKIACKLDFFQKLHECEILHKSFYYRAGEVMPQSVMGKISMMCAILQAILKKKTFDFDMELPRLLQQTSQVFLFAYIWSIGSNLQDRYHAAFDAFVRGQFANEELCK